MRPSLTFSSLIKTFESHQSQQRAGTLFANLCCHRYFTPRLLVLFGLVTYTAQVKTKEIISEKRWVRKQSCTGLVKILKLVIIATGDCKRRWLTGQ